MVLLTGTCVKVRSSMMRVDGGETRQVDQEQPEGAEVAIRKFSWQMERGH